MSTATPMIQQYHAIKARHQDAILFFRLGDFYEMFFEDAREASLILDLILTARGTDANNKIPMCGIPYHSSENYIARLVKAGKKVAICEQIEDPALAQGLVKRDVIRVISAGTILDESVEARYLLAVCPGKNYGIAFIDVAAGTMFLNELSRAQTLELLGRLPIAECLYPEENSEIFQALLADSLVKTRALPLSPCADWMFNSPLAYQNLCDHLSVGSLKGFGVDHLPQAIAAAGAMLAYLKNMNQRQLKHIHKIALYAQDDYLFISPAAHYGLELESVLKTIDLTLTPMGRRTLRFWLYHPLKEITAIQSRQHAAQALRTLPALKEALKGFPDIPKALSRISCGCGTIKDMLHIREGLSRMPLMTCLLTPLNTPLLHIPLCTDLYELLTTTLNPDVPLGKPEGKMIQEGVDKQLDALKGILENGRQWLADYQTQEIKKTGISSLKVGFNNVSGFYIEISKARGSTIPEGYVRRQTLVNAERYITPELKEYESQFLNAQEEILTIEKRIVTCLEEEILTQSARLHEACDAIAIVDCLWAFSQLALKPHYLFAEINNSSILNIKDGRHPVVAQTLTDNFIANDTFLNTDDQHLIILTGPNMAGKSTWIRQSAILVILAQMGAPIPATAASIGLVDKVFTRIGAHDDIAKGQSTFMVEMTQTADILNNLTHRSLVILDEIGRGTSTCDGLSLAWALAEHMHQQRVRTLFATHFHELTLLSKENNGIKNYHVLVREWQNKIIFMHKIIPGSSDDSYGIYVAQLAGIPDGVIHRSKEILTTLEHNTGAFQETPNNNPDLLAENYSTIPCAVCASIATLDINTLTPMEALQALDALKRKLL